VLSKFLSLGDSSVCVMLPVRWGNGPVPSARSARELLGCRPSI
jgi:hypothetical protein